jgi:diguanylate cyclase (GGDEF)-like protein
MNEKPIILLVDDSATNIQLLAACLKDDYQLKIATSGEQCLQIAPKQPLPDLILLDIEMPGLNGYEVCKQLKDQELTADIPVIFVTARETNADEEKGLSLGAVDYFTKPIHPAIVVARVRTHMTLKIQRDKLEKLALHDQLTNLYNRYYMLDIAKHKVAKAIRHQHKFCVLMIDIDHFKSVNDEHGHMTGDAILKATAKQLLKASRQEDIVCRWGGEEFLILLDACELEDAVRKANKLRQVIFDLNPHGIKTTISLGAAEFCETGEENFDNLLKRADEALYRAKNAGRNRVEISHQ